MSCHSFFLMLRLSSYFLLEIPPLSLQLYIDIFPPAVYILSQAMFRLTALSEICSTLIPSDTWHVGVSGGGGGPK